MSVLNLRTNILSGNCTDGNDENTKFSAEDCTLLHVGNNSKTVDIKDSYNFQRIALSIYQLLDTDNSGYSN
jgi:hypothetical protein